MNGVVAMRFDFRISTCFDAMLKLTLKKLGNSVVGHNFRQANILFSVGSKLAMIDRTLIVLTPLDAVIDQFKMDQLSSKLLLWSTCNKLTCFGNLFVITH
ncbi:hypothetical protein H5410_037433 [Solanum commersonii]|uniref:Uncharacterized protein n=1 Tax=Solanum commersonii TaxID=4109 RepID=A0A9J5Y746_SOLCO|nr:hypothetical protein H5410_037433 [Solanum commersonii]